MKVKVHIADIPHAGKQRCIRCHTLLGRDPMYWEAGAYVKSSRGGMRVLDVTEAILLPRCGRDSRAPIDLPNDPVHGLHSARMREAEGRG